MRSRLSGPGAAGTPGRGGVGSDVAAPWLVLAACWLPVLLLAAVWVAGHAASWVSGHGWAGPPLDGAFAVLLLRGGVAAAWPAVPPALVWALAAAMVVVPGLGAAVLVAGFARAGGGDPAGALASADDVAALTPRGVRSRALVLRPSLRQVPGGPAAADCGVRLGGLRRPGRWSTPRWPRLRWPGAGRSGRRSGQVLRASWEDVVLAVMAPRAGKTTALAVPALLEAPGPVVATSNKADLWAATAQPRGGDTGERVWVFDPQRIAHAEQTWWWDPLRGVSSVEEAHRLAGHFVQEVRGHRHRDFWTSAAHDLLTCLLLAAALDGRTLVEVYEWLNDAAVSTPADLLRRHGRTAAAASLRGRQHGAPETRDGVYETARTAAQCLRDERILAWVTPPEPLPFAGLDGLDGPGGAGAPHSTTHAHSRHGMHAVVERFDPGPFVTSRQTLYLLSRDGAGAAAPLVAALTDRVVREAVRAAERRGGRLDPPMLVVLDEAANVCRIGDLPDLYSHLGSRGVVPVTILQSYRQGTRVWGEIGMDALWSAATCKVIGSGIDDAKVAEDLSRLVGDHDVPVRSVSRGRGGVSSSTSPRRQRILPPEAIRALPRGTALLLATGCRAALIDLTPWYAGPRAREVADAAALAERQLAQRAAGGAPERTDRGGVGGGTW